MLIREPLIASALILSWVRWQTFSLSVLFSWRLIQKVVLHQRLFCRNLCVCRMPLHFVLRHVVIVVCSGKITCSSLIEISLNLIVLAILSLLWFVVPIVEAIAPCNLFEIAMIFFKIVTEALVMLFLYWIVLFVVSTHIDAKIFNATDCILPCKRALAVMNLRNFSSHVTSGWSDFELLFLIKHSFSSPILSAFLRGTHLFWWSLQRRGRFLFMTLHKVGLGCPTGGPGLQKITQSWRVCLLRRSQVTWWWITLLLARSWLSCSCIRVWCHICGISLLSRRSKSTINHGWLGALLAKVVGVFAATLRWIANFIYHDFWGSPFRAALIIVFESVELWLGCVPLVNKVLGLLLSSLKLISLSLSRIQTVIT